MAIVTVLGLYSCQPENETPSEDKLRADSLQAIINERDNTINEFFSAINEINDNLALIKEKENIISVNTSSGNEITPDIKNQINEDILTIYNLLEKNRAKLNHLNQRLKDSDIKILELNKMIEKLTKELEEKNNEITALTEELEVLNIIIDDLNANIDSITKVTENQNEIINEKDQELNTAYYVYGTTKELKANEIITKEGGFVGIGAVEKLMKDFNKNYFTKIDIRETKRIPLMVKKAKIITNHPTDSYVFDGPDGRIDNLIITDPDKFWSISKYLVIVTD
ncbi:MAG: hypothetical protein Kow0068_19730 [Marinilabiliales bacterium]